MLSKESSGTNFWLGLGSSSMPEKSKLAEEAWFYISEIRTFY